MIYFIGFMQVVIVYLLWKNATNQASWSRAQHLWLTEIRNEIRRLKP